MKRWDNLTSLFVAESLVESLPLVLIATLFTFIGRMVDFCALSICDAETVARHFPPWAMSLSPSAKNISPDEVAALQRHGCGDSPLTSDGWFTMKFAAEGTIYILETRSGRFLERVQDFALPGAREACNIPLADCVWNRLNMDIAMHMSMEFRRFMPKGLHRSEQPRGAPMYLMSLL
jgi:hypothetical protein